ncbi:MAG: ATP-binding protein [Sphingobium sp.]
MRRSICYRRMVQTPPATPSLDNRRFNRIVLALLGGGFLALLIAGGATVVLLLRNEEQSGWVRHTYEVERHVAAIQLSLARMRASPGRDGFQQGQEQLRNEVAEVGKLTVDNPVQQQNVAELTRRAVALENLYDAGTPDDAAVGGAETALRELALKMLRIERALLTQRTGVEEQGAYTLYGVLGMSGVLLLLLGAGSMLIIRRYTNSLTDVHAQLRVLNEGLEDAVAVRTVDLQRANDEIQRFAYIVSHDLRSPLVNVMGFTAELEASSTPLLALIADVEAQSPGLATEAAKVAIREDIPEAIGFIRSSTQKMDRLINAILRLSREGRRTISLERLELNGLAHGIVDNMRHRIDELGVEIVIDPDMPVIVSDRLAVEQILGNLVENAVKYLKPGRPGLIEISGKTRFGRAMIDVTDNGRGIDQRDHDRVFDLFRRSGEQDQPGEGIGLAHVRALAYRLGGTIHLRSELGTGSTFTIILPAAFSGDKGTSQ